MSKDTDIAEDDVYPEEPDVIDPLPTRLQVWSEVLAVGRETGRETWNALKLILVLLVLCGVVYPLIVFAVGQVAFHHQANGSLITNAQGQVIGSTLLGQQFTRTEYFHA